MAKWISGAIKHKGALKRKAGKAGETVKTFAAQHAGDPGTTGKQARLAETLMGMHKSGDKVSHKKAKKVYPNLA